MPEPRAGHEGAAGQTSAQTFSWVGSPESLADTLLALPLSEAAAAIRSAPDADSDLGVPVLERVALTSQTELALAAAEALGSIRSDDAARALDRVASASSAKAVQKAARRSLYRLSSQGIKVTPAAQVAPATTGTRSATLYRAIASAYDGSGTRAMWLGAERPLGGIYMIALMLNDLNGLTDCHARDTTRKRFADDEMKMRQTDPMAWVELPFDYARQLVSEAIENNRAERKPIPPTYAVWSELIGTPEEPFSQALVYKEISAIEARLHPTLQNEAARLFEQPEVEPWFAPPTEARKWARQMTDTVTSRLIVTPESDTERQERILKEAVKELFPPKAIHGIRRRLEETAYIFLRTGREQDARRAVAAAVTIEELRPLQPPHPFLRMLALRSLQIAYEVERSGAEPARLALAPRG